MRVLFHDYGGHSHTVKLARALARLGLSVSYVSFAGFGTPKGKVDASPDDPASFKISELQISRPMDKDNLVRRLLQQREYATVLQSFAEAERPDVVISSNSPVEVQEMLLSYCRRERAGFVFWCQDIHSEAIGRILAKKNKILGWASGTYYRRKERRLFEQSDELIVIAESFKSVLQGAPWSVGRSDIHVIENIAPLDEIPMFPRDNRWAQDNMRVGRARIVYTGTLARKHNPDLLLHLARHLDTDVWLFAEGASADYVTKRAKEEGLSNVFVRPWLSVEELPLALAAADLLLVVIEQGAGVFSVPSKVLSYLAAGRPILGSLPLENLAAATIAKTGAGLVSPPQNLSDLVEQAKTILSDEGLRRDMGDRGRRYAEEHFQIGPIAKSFEHILMSAHQRAEARQQAR